MLSLIISPRELTQILPTVFVIINYYNCVETRLHVVFGRTFPKHSDSFVGKTVTVR